ncbi:hypothetical protein [Ornithinimicrobium kibberense]
MSRPVASSAWTRPPRPPSALRFPHASQTFCSFSALMASFRLMKRA